MLDGVRYAAGWFAAAVVSFGAAWLGVDVVAHQLTDDRPPALSESEIDRALAARTSSTLSPSSTLLPGGVSPGVPPTDATVPTSPSPSSSTAPPPAGDSTPSTPTTRPSAAPPTSSPGSTGTAPSTAAPVTATPVTAAPAPVTRTYQVAGGSAAVRFSAAGAEVVWATPAAGYEVRISAHHDNGVRIEFRDDGGRIDAWWAGGPVDEVRRS